MSQRAFRTRGGTRRWPVACPTCGSRAGRSCVPNGLSGADYCPDHVARKRAIKEYNDAHPTG